MYNSPFGWTRRHILDQLDGSWTDFWCFPPRREKNHARGHTISAELVGDKASTVRKSFALEFWQILGLQKSALSFWMRWKDLKDDYIEHSNALHLIHDGWTYFRCLWNPSDPSCQGWAAKDFGNNTIQQQLSNYICWWMEKSKAHCNWVVL